MLFLILLAYFNPHKQIKHYQYTVLDIILNLEMVFNLSL